MTGAPGRQCPECGRSALREASLYRTRRRWGWAAAGAIALSLGIAGAARPFVTGPRIDWIEWIPNGTLVRVVMNDRSGRLSWRFAGELRQRLNEEELSDKQLDDLFDRALDVVEEGPAHAQFVLAAERLMWSGVRDPRITTALVGALEGTPGDPSHYVLAAIWIRRSDLDAVGPALVSMATDPAQLVRRRTMALGVIARYGPVAQPLAPAVLGLADHADPDVRLAAAGALGAMDLRTPEAIGALRAALRDIEPEVRSIAATALALMRRDEPEAALWIASEIDRVASRWIPADKIATLGFMGPVAASALPTLRRLASPGGPLEGSLVAENAIRAIEGDIDFAGIMIAQLEAPAVEEQREASSALKLLFHYAPARAAETVPPLIELLGSSNPETLSLVGALLWNSGDLGRPALPRLRELAATHPVERVRDRARMAIGGIVVAETPVLGTPVGGGR